MPPLKHPVRIIHFLKPGYGKSVAPKGNGHFPAAGRTNLRTPVLVRKPPAQDAEPEHIRDARTLTATELRLKYRTTYDSWKNMKSRRKSHGAIIAPEFETFPSFLTIQGPRPAPAYTLDRLDNDNPTYGPGLCQWRDKIAQANNRRSTIHLTHDGNRLALSEWARQTGQRADTMRKRKAAGWSDPEIVTGKRTAPTQPANFPWPSNTKEGRERWEQYWLSSNVRNQSRPGKFGQFDKWISCLRAAKMPRIRRDHDETFAPDAFTGLQGEGGACRHQGRQDAGRVGSAI